MISISSFEKSYRIVSKAPQNIKMIFDNMKNMVSPPNGYVLVINSLIYFDRIKKDDLREDRLRQTDANRIF